MGANLVKTGSLLAAHHLSSLRTEALLPDCASAGTTAAPPTSCTVSRSGPTPWACLCRKAAWVRAWTA